MSIALLLACCLSAGNGHLLRGGPACADELPLHVPDGFTVTRVAGDDLAHDIWCLTLDERGRIVVGGPGYIRRLEDADGDGVSDLATQLATFDKGGPQGLCYFDGVLYHVGPGRLGTLRESQQGDAQPAINLQFRSSGEHGPHAIVPGPDGCLYLVCGNDADPGKGVMRESALAEPPVAGRVLRIDPRSGRIDNFAWGFRNPYDLAFTREGRLLTVDSDNERSHYLPWYAPTRLLEVHPKHGHGWLLAGYQSSWNRPASWFDSVPRVAEFGRGSPTGLEVYRHTQFPPRYRGGVFSACWTFGRVYFVELSTGADGVALSGRVEEFLAPTGNDGFAPVDLAVSPAGDLLAAIGGRQTQGGVYRVRHEAGIAPAGQPAQLDLDRVLSSPQPLTAWSRAQWLPAARRLGREAFVAAAFDSQRDEPQRVRAIEIVTELFGGLRTDELRQLSQAPPVVRARVAWSLGAYLSTHDAAEDGAVANALRDATRDQHALVQAVAWETLADTSIADAMSRPDALLSPADGVRRAAYGYLRRHPDQLHQALFDVLRNDQQPQAALAELIARVLLGEHGGQLQLRGWSIAGDLAMNRDLEPARRLDAVR
ncbi:MAG: hypothetical protein K1X74_20260, partial [Pirellulales bacterium]|nr:hypothetical protein [Pirellulales bacterium]